MIKDFMFNLYINIILHYSEILILYKIVNIARLFIILCLHILLILYLFAIMITIYESIIKD